MTNELMIGDYFYRPDCVDRVVEVRKNGVIGTDSLRGLIPWSEIKPIEPTSEILEKNGWIMRAIRDAKWIAVYEGKGYPDIWEDIDGNLTITIGVDADAQVSSVHQLQHILRLCGQNELADNFKI